MLDEIAHTPALTSVAATPDMPLDLLGRTAKAHVERGDKALGKAEDHFKAAGIHLLEAKKRIQAGANGDDGNALTFDAFLAEHNIGRSRAYEFIAIASGKTTIEAIREKTAARVARHAERNREARAKAESVANGQPDKSTDAIIAAWTPASSDTRQRFLDWAGLRYADGDASLPAPEIWIPQTFKIERIGNATVYLGDCRDVLPTLNTVGHVLTDPPYEDDAHKAQRRTQKAIRDGVDDDLGFAAITATLRRYAAEQAARLSTGWALFFCQTDAAYLWRQAIEMSGAKYKGVAQWVKPDSSPQFTGDKPAINFETMALAWCGSGRSFWNAGGKRGTYICNTNGQHRDGRHKTEKPVGLIRELLNDFTNPGETILDPFMGSGSVGVACIGSERNYIGIERDPEYFTWAVERLEKANGTGSLFDPANDNHQPDLLVAPDADRKFTEDDIPAFLRKEAS